MKDPRYHRRCGASLWSALLSIVLVSASSRAQTGEQLVSLDVDKSHLGYTYIGTAGQRYFTTNVSVTNLASRRLSIPVSAFQLLVDGVPYPVDIEHPKLTGYDFRVEGTAYRFRDLETAEVLQISEKTSASTWLVFPDLPKSQDVPKLLLQLEIAENVHTLDVTAHYDELLKLKSERIGPRDALGLLTIDGSLNSINVGTLVNTVDRLATARVSRVVVDFGDEAADLDEPLGSWLRQTAEGVHTSRTYAMFPAVVATIREFHVADIPGQASAADHVHTSIESAVQAALASAYRGLSADEIVAEIEDGHPLARAAALINGGPELPQTYLPMLMSRVHSDDEQTRRGALVAISGSGQPEAVSLLAESAASDNHAESKLALEALAASRYPMAHDALARLLGESLVVEQTEIVEVLARYPRPQWSEYLARLALSDEAVEPDVQRKVLLALGRIGHPQLLEILSRGLKSSQAQVQSTAFTLLLSQEDKASEQMAVDFALLQLDEGPPTSQMLQLFDRARDPRVVERLMPLLDDPEKDRAALIQTLSRIGTSDVADELADRYELMKPNEQAAVLTNLVLLRSPRLPALAGSGLNAEDDILFRAAVRSLSMLSDDFSVKVLSERLLIETDLPRATSLSQALQDIGVPAAVKGLELARASSQGEKRDVIEKRLETLALKSPGGQHLRRAERLVALEKHEEALTHYTFAIERDPDLARAFSGRGHCQLKLENYKEAADDCRHAIALQPDDPLAVTGLGIALAVLGELDEAVKIVKDAEERFPDEWLYSYNAACVYGRVIEQVNKRPDSQERDELRRQYEQAAIALLEKSLEQGFDQIDWMQQDPDLATLHGLEGFQKLSIPMEEPKETSDDAPARGAKKSLPQKTFSKPEPGEQ